MATDSPPVHARTGRDHEAGTRRQHYLPPLLTRSGWSKPAASSIPAACPCARSSKKRNGSVRWQPWRPRRQRRRSRRPRWLPRSRPSAPAALAVGQPLQGPRQPLPCGRSCSARRQAAATPAWRRRRMMTAGCSGTMGCLPSRAAPSPHRQPPPLQPAGPPPRYPRPAAGPLPWLPPLPAPCPRHLPSRLAQHRVCVPRRRQRHAPRQRPPPQQARTWTPPMPSP